MTGHNISHIDIRRIESGEFYFVFRLPGNGAFVSIFFGCMSEVMAAIEESQRNSEEDAYYFCKSTPANDSYFVFGSKSLPIGQSTIYKEASLMNVGLQYMQKNLQRAEVVDLTI